jgi:hypothetical protein
MNGTAPQSWLDLYPKDLVSLQAKLSVRDVFSDVSIWLLGVPAVHCPVRIRVLEQLRASIAIGRNYRHKNFDLITRSKLIEQVNDGRIYGRQSCKIVSEVINASSRFMSENIQNFFRYRTSHASDHYKVARDMHVTVNLICLTMT